MVVLYQRTITLSMPSDRSLTPTKGSLGKYYYAGNLKSVAIYLRYRIGIPYRKTTELLRELFGLKPEVRPCFRPGVRP